MERLDILFLNLYHRDLELEDRLSIDYGES